MNLADLLNERGLTGNAVEVGTHRADFAEPFLRVWKGEVLYCVDPWSIPPGYEEQAKSLWGGGNRGADFEYAQRVLERYRPRAKFMRGLSAEIATLFRKQSLDFVFVDGDHSYKSVWKDLWSWFPKIRAGGILAGHDFVMPGEKDGAWARFVQPAVMKFASSWKLEINLVVEPDGLPWSFYLEKPK